MNKVSFDLKVKTFYREPQRDLSWPLSPDQAAYSVYTNLAATVGSMYAAQQVNENLLPWSTFEGKILPELVESFIHTHDILSTTYEEDLKAFAEESLEPVRRGETRYPFVY